MTGKMCPEASIYDTNSETLIEPKSPAKQRITTERGTRNEGVPGSSPGVGSEKSPDRREKRRMVHAGLSC